MARDDRLAAALGGGEQLPELVTRFLGALALRLRMRRLCSPYSLLSNQLGYRRPLLYSAHDTEHESAVILRKY